jgi:hypothetical protein
MYVDLTIAVLTILDSVVTSLNRYSKQVELRAKQHVMDKVMETFQIEVAEFSHKDVIPIVHYNLGALMFRVIKQDHVYLCHVSNFLCLVK